MKLRRGMLWMFLMVPTVVLAFKPPNVTPGEMALIPRYCADAQGFGYGDAYYNTSPKAGYWVGLMGKSFWHIHHYCWALLAKRRADFTAHSARERQALREGAIDDLSYVIRNSPPDFVLLPEVLTTLGGVQILLGNAGGASDSFLKARELKPDYWPAYSDWAEYLIKTGQRGQAKPLIQEGLEWSPNSRTLQDQFRLLGGNFADIVPRARRPPPAAEPANTGESANPADPEKVPTKQGLENSGLD